MFVMAVNISLQTLARDITGQPELHIEVPDLDAQLYSKAAMERVEVKFDLPRVVNYSHRSP